MRKNITKNMVKMSKMRVISMLIVCCFFVQSTFNLSTALSSYGSDGSIVFEDDFQNYEPGILMRLTDLSPKLWQGYELVINPGGTGNAQFEINRDPLTGNQSLLLRDDYATPAGWLELRRTFPEITSGIVTVDIGFMQPVTATGARPLRIVDSAGNEVARLDTRAGPAISVRNHDGTVFTEMGRYSANEWVRIRLIIDLNNRIFNAFFNGRRVGEFPFNSAVATGIARIESRTPGSAVRSHFIDNVLVAPYKKIEAPVNFNAVAGDRQVNFTWDAVWGASTYTLKKGLESGGPYQIVATGVRDTSYLLTGLTNDVAYYFVVKAVTEDKMESDLSLEVRAVPSTVPATPENITYTLDFATVSLSWDAVPTADSYVIRYGIQKELLEHSLEVHANKHVFDDLKPGQIYFFTVSAKNEIGEGSPSQPLAIRAGDAKIYQAEYAVFPGSGIESIADRNFTGSGYVNMSSIVGSYIEWTVGMDAAGLQTLRLYYSLGRTDQTRPMSVSVNGMVIRDRVEFEPTFAGVFPSWGVWNTVEIKDVMLNEGPNKIRFTVLEFDGPNIDKLTVTGQPGLEYRVLSVESLGLGRVEVSPAGAVFPCTYVKGTIVTLNAAPGNLFKFSHWSGDLTGSQNPVDVTLDRNLAIQAHFLPDLEYVERAPGFAGLGIGTFGGFGGEVITVTNKEEFRNAIRDNVSRIVQVSGSIDLGQGAWIPVGSFKTILGLGDDAELLGGGLLLAGSTQVIIRNLRLGNAITPGYDPVTGVDAEFDALQINNSTHVWVDQCTFKNDAEIWVNNETSFDGLLDIINGSSYITISNSIFENHNQTMLIGNSDTLLSDRGRFRITLFNNWFRGTTTRHPRVRFGQVHVFNNYFDAVGYGMGVGVEASIISESNYFKNTAEPWRYLDSAAQPGFIRSEGDLFRESALIPEREEGVTWNPAEKYGYVLKAPESARAHTRVRAGAGRAGKVIRIDNESVTTGIRTHEITGTAAEKTILRVYNNAVLVLTREIDAYSDFRIPVYLNPGKNSFEIKADGDVVRLEITFRVPVTGINVVPEALKINVGTTHQLVAEVIPDYAADKSVIWTSSNALVATVDANGRVTGVAGGTAVITGTTVDGSHKDTSIVTVFVPTTGVKVFPETVKVNVGMTHQLFAEVIPVDASDKSVTWTSNNTKVATVDVNGIVKGIRVGTAIITATTADGHHKDTSIVTVVIPVRSVRIVQEERTVRTGQDRRLVAIVMPANATNKDVIWSSSDPTIATVSAKGVVRGVRAGTAVITVTTVDGNHADTITITVKEHRRGRRHR